MRTLVLVGIAAGLLCGSSILATPASAGVAAYLSRTGGGSLCTLTAPCSDMTTAIGVAGAGGEVICLDKGRYGGPAITFSITISCGEGLWEVPGNATVMVTPAGADVVIEGLVSDALGGAGQVLTFGGQGALHLRRVRLGNNGSNTGGNAINFRPNGPAKLFVSDSYVYNVGTGGITSGILLRPDPGVAVSVVIERTRIENNRFGIVADGSNGGSIRGVVRDSVIAGSTNNGITVSTTGSNVVLTVDNSTISGNNLGLVATGANAGMLVRRSVINSNATGLFTASGGVILSYKDNSLNGNTTADGVFTGPVGLQ